VNKKDTTYITGFRKWFAEHPEMHSAHKILEETSTLEKESALAALMYGVKPGEDRCRKRSFGIQKPAAAHAA
jgi:hypothetical protein